MEVESYINRGYKVINEGTKYTTLEKQKKFSWFWFLFWMLFFGIGAVFYLIYYMVKGNKMVTVTSK